MEQIEHPDPPLGGVEVEVGHPPSQQRVAGAQVVVDVETGEHGGHVATWFVHLEQFAHRVTQRLVPIVGLAERRLNHRVAQHPGADRVAFVRVGVEQAAR